MNKRNTTDLYKNHLFYTSQKTFKCFSEKCFTYYHHLVDAVMAGVYNPDKSIVDNVNEYIKRAYVEVKFEKEFGEAIDYFHQTIKSLDEKSLDKFYNKKLIDYILEFDLVPYQQVDITRMYFMNEHKSMEEKLEFLHAQINAIYNGGNDFRIINSLDKIRLNPEVLQNDIIYQMFMEYMVRVYVKDYNKYNVTDKIKDKKARYIIRMIYRHQNRGYFIPSAEVRDNIVNSYAYNGWFKELKFMIENNKIGITKDNYMNVVEQIDNGFNDMACVCNFSRGQYIDMNDKFNEIIASVADVAEDNQRLIRKGEE